MFVVDNELFHVFDVDSEKLREALLNAGYKVGVIADRVPYDTKGNVIDGPKVREILRAIKEGRVPSPARPSPKKAVSPVEAIPEVPAKPKPKPAKKKAPAKKAKKGGA